MALRTHMIEMTLVSIKYEICVALTHALCRAVVRDSLNHSAKVCVM